MSEFFDSPTPQRRTPPPEDRRISRARGLVLSVVLLALLAILATGAWLTGAGPFAGESDLSASPQPYGLLDSTGLLGDIDADGKISEVEKKSLTSTRASVSSLQEHAFARDGVNTVLLTPPGDLWWDLVASAANTLDIADAPPPSTASWYAMTETATHDENRTNSPYPGYQSLFLKFPDKDKAATWATQAGNLLGYQHYAIYARDDGLLTMTPAFIEPRKEPLPLQAGGKDPIGNLDVTQGYWSINWSDWLKIRAESSIDPEAFTRIWSSLGITGGTWEATSPRPDAAWTGVLDGYDSSGVDPVKSLQAINTFGADCSNKNECLQSEGARDAVSLTWFEKAGQPMGGLDKWRHPLAPRDSDWYAAMAPSFDSQLFGTRAVALPPVLFTAYWFKDGKLSIWPVLGEAAQGITARQ